MCANFMYNLYVQKNMQVTSTSLEPNTILVEEIKKPKFCNLRAQSTDTCRSVKS